MESINRDRFTEARYRRIITSLGKGILIKKIAEKENVTLVTIFRYITLALKNKHIVKNKTYSTTDEFTQYCQAVN
jgi:transposase